MENKNPYQKQIDEAHMALWDIEMSKGKPHSHFEVVDPATAELFRKASENVGSIALREVGLTSEEAFDIAEKQVISTQGYADLEDKGYVGFEVSTVADENGQHPENGTSDFYRAVNELKSEEVKE